MTEKTPIKHIEPAKEKAALLMWPEKIALHARLLLSQNALNPENCDIAQIDQTQLQSIDIRDYNIYNKSSVAVRKKYYEKSTDAHDREKWNTDFVDKVRSSKSFFAQTDDGKRWERLFLSLGLHAQSITKEEVNAFYQHYLQGDEKKGQIKLFVQDVINYHRDEKGAIRLNDLEKNSDAITWIAHVFGDDTTIAMVSELVRAESRLIFEQAAFVKALNTPAPDSGKIRLNTLKPTEHTLLANIWKSVSPFVLPEQTVPAEKKQTEPAKKEKQQTTENPAKTTHTTPKENKSPSPEPTAVFTNETKELLTKCGLNPDHVNPIPIGKGANHTVFSYEIPGKEKQVIKIPNPHSAASLTKGMIEEDANITTVIAAFPRFAIPTLIKKDPDSDRYCIVQQAVTGTPLTQLNCKPELKKQLQDIIALNHRLIETQHISLDFVGMPGFFTWIKRQFRRHGPFEVSNIMIDSQGQLKIIDYDIFDFNHGSSIRHKIASRIGFIANRFLMHHYFGVDIQSPVISSQQSLIPKNA